MSCTRHVLNFEWEHHNWRPEVTSADTWTQRETTMWGGSANVHYTHCMKHFVCETCGRVGDAIDCVCDCEQGDECPPRLAWIERSRGAEK